MIFFTLVGVSGKINCIFAFTQLLINDSLGAVLLLSFDYKIIETKGLIGGQRSVYFSMKHYIVSWPNIFVYN